MPSWNPEQYLAFDEERTRPCRDLAARVDLPPPLRIVDLGCGPGNSTAVLASRWPEAAITGLDSSEAMIAAAQASLPSARFITADIAVWAFEDEGQYDLVFANAALQWVPDHANVYPRLLDRVAPGGALAVQMPANGGAPAHQLMRDIAASPRWQDRFSGTVRQWYAHDPDFYYDLLAARCRRIDLWRTEYFHVLADAAAIVEWYKGTGLRPFLDALKNEAWRQEFLDEYREGIGSRYPVRPDGRVLFPFLRSFAIAYR